MNSINLHVFVLNSVEFTFVFLFIYLSGSNFLQMICAQLLT